jgi:hypothetical protein
MVCPKESSGKKQIINIFKRKVIVMVVLRLQATLKCTQLRRNLQAGNH